jgi:hypothetical protein
MSTFTTYATLSLAAETLAVAPERVGTYRGKTAEQWRESARANAQRRNDSWERSDTDGFLSQWGAQVMEAENRACADLAETDGRSVFPALFTLAGELVNARRISTRYGFPWAVFAPEDTEQRGNVLAWVNESEARKASTRANALAKKGYAIGSVEAPAFIKLVGEVAVYPVTLRDRYADASEVRVLTTSGFDSEDRD